MPTLSIIKAGNKCACSYSGEENEITVMLTQCALRDELFANTIIQSSLNINRIRMGNKSDVLGSEVQTEK
ncbi:MAG: hypothetical protein Q8S54_01160 [Bacteroidota bacterium]|nr:hypothetical protein [Bacteroidota bacterium]